MAAYQKITFMKKIKVMIIAAVAAISLTGCGSVGMVGAVYHNVTEPAGVTSNIVGHKVGTAKATSILGIAAFGDAGVNEAAKNGNITRISHIDVKTFSILGVYTSRQYFVYGE